MLHEEIAHVIQFAQSERIAALEHISKEREAVLIELQKTIQAEHQLLISEAEQISVRVVDHALRRVALLTGIVLIALFLGVVVLLLITRRLFAAALGGAGETRISPAGA